MDDNHLAASRDELVAGLRRLGDARQAAALADQRVVQERGEVHRLVRLHGLALLAAGEPQPPRDLMRELYWDHPEVAVEESRSPSGCAPRAMCSASSGPTPGRCPAAGAAGGR